MNYKYVWLTVYVLSTFFIGAGCDGPTVVGSGVSRSEDREIDKFQSVSIYGVGSIKIKVGPATPLTITADDNMLKHVRSEIKGGVLHVGVRRGNYTWHGFPEFELSVPELNSLQLAGQTQASVTGLDQKEFRVTTSGQNGVTLAGAVSKLVLNLEGQSSCDAINVSAKSVMVRSIEENVQCAYFLNASELISGNIAGTSSIEHTGMPTLDVKTNAKTSIKHRE